MGLDILKWWLIAQLLGWSALPVTRRVFAWLPDRGYAFSKLVGLLLVSYLLWAGASGGLLENSTGGIVLAVGLVAGLSLWLELRAGRGQLLVASFKVWWGRRNHILRVEALFLLAFVGWALVRAYAPSKIVYAYGEKFMEFAFLNGVLRSPAFPPLDPWLAGYAVSYYYFGYVMMALVTRLAGSTPGVGFDLYDALLFALTLSAAYGLVVNLVQANRGKARTAAGFGLLGALFVGGMGNLQGVIHALHSARSLPESFTRWLSIPDLLTDPQSGSLYPGHGFYQWWWWRASRVLEDLDLGHQPFGAQPITEFPFFSFLLGDNHPHKLALPFVLLAIGLALNLLLRQTSQGRAAGRLARVPRRKAQRPGSKQLRHITASPARNNPVRLERQDGWVQQGKAWLQQQLADFPLAQRALAKTNLALRVVLAGWQPAGLGRWLFYALALGGLGFLNTWDFPIYLGLTVLAYTAGNYWLRGRFTRADLLASLRLGAGLGTASVGLYLLFYLSFSSQASGILPFIFPPTRLVQFSVMFGPFLFICAFFLVGLALAAFRARGWSLATGMRQVAKTWLWITLASYGPYLLVVGLALALLASGGLGLDEGIRRQIEQGMGGIPAGLALGLILFERISSPWTYLSVSLLMAVGLAAALKGAGRERPGERPVAAQRQISPAALFAALLAVSGLALALSVEFFYLRDSFGLRMNTVFKFYFQAWVMLAVASAFGLWWFWQHAPASRAARVSLAAGAAVLATAGLVYSGMGIVSRTHAFSYPPNLDASATLSGQYGGHWSELPDDWAAIQWLQRNVAGAPIILEAPTSGSYNLRGRISAFTGLPTLLGWGGHEYQWRGSGEAASQRSPDIETIFTTPNGQIALDLLHKWAVRFVVIGELERGFINEACANHCDPRRALEKFEQVLAPVFVQGQTTVYIVPAQLP